MPEWIDRKRLHWPAGSKERALGGKSAIEALGEAMRQPKSALELLNDDDLALLLAHHIMEQTNQLEARHPTREGHRNPDTDLPPSEGGLCL